MLRTEIITPELILRKYELSLAPRLLEAAQASYSPDFTRFAPWCHANYSLADSERIIERCEAGWLEGSAFTFALLADLPDVRRLEILTLPENVASQRAALAAGATREGLLRQRLRVGPEQRDAILFALVRPTAM